MYDVPDYFLVANPIDRYSIGDRTPGVSPDDDGSLTITSARRARRPDREANWLPAPAGAFRPMLRMYEPGAERPRPDLHRPTDQPRLTDRDPIAARRP